MWPFRSKIARPPDPASPARPTDLVYGHYRVLPNAEGGPWLLGHGAMGLTYKAEDINLRAPVALKVINPLISEKPGAREFFLAEARGAASLRHRNAAAVHHLGVNRTGELFFAMEFIEGETVDALIKRQRRLDVPLALDIAQQTACALAAARQRGIVHRDLKPANLMLSDEGDGALVVKVIDFGLCKLVPRDTPAADPSGKTVPDEFFGTPHYASPEQIRCERNLDCRADFYSLGATLWTMLAGRPVFHGPLAAIRQRHLDEAPPFQDLPEDVSPPVRELLAALLHKDPAGRPQTPLELIDRIEGAAYDHRGAAADPRRHWKTQGCVPLLGSVLAHNYHLEALAEENPDGLKQPVFRAEDVAGHRPVAVQLLDRDQPLDGVRSSMERLVAAPHPNLVGKYALSSCRGQPFIVREWINGFPLRDVLVARGGMLPPVEVQRLVEQAARAWEHIQTHELGSLDLHLGAIQVQFTEQAPDESQRRALPSQPMSAWPDFSLKFRVRDLASGAPWQGGADSARETVRQLGHLTAELLGSGQCPTEAFSEGVDVVYPASVPCAVDHIINRAVASPPDFASATEFTTALVSAFREDAII